MQPYCLQPKTAISIDTESELTFFLSETPLKCAICRLHAARHKTIVRISFWNAFIFNLLYDYNVPKLQLVLTPLILKTLRTSRYYVNFQVVRNYYALVQMTFSKPLLELF